MKDKLRLSNKMKVNQCIILAGGLGTRLRPLTNDIPKPMVPVDGQPFLALQIAYLISQGITHFVLCVGYKHEKIMDYFGDGQKWGVHIDYAIETELLGTGGAIKNAETYLDQYFFVFNGDTYLEVDLTACVQQYEHYQKSVLMVLKKLEDCQRYGTVELDEQNTVITFKEKQASIGEGLINAGCYLMNNTILQKILNNQKISLETEIFPNFLGDIAGYQTSGYFIDIGTFDSYDEFVQKMRAYKK